MQIDWSGFTPWSALAGGALLGVAAAVFALFNGRVAGVSGIIGELFGRARGEAGWRLAFIAGLVLAPLGWRLLSELPAVTVETGFGVIAVAGALVGVSTRYGSGCTSGHGVCGVSLCSLRSLAATVAFMASGFATVYIVRHVIGA